MTIQELTNIYNTLTIDTRIQLSELGKPDTIGGVVTPDDFNSVSFGDYLELMNIEANRNFFIEPLRILLKIEEPEKVDAEEAVGFSNWVQGELKKVGELFKSIQRQPTDRELRAGIEELNFGTFGIIDWYSQRQHISNQDDVLLVPWSRIYICMRNDNLTKTFQEKLMRIK